MLFKKPLANEALLSCLSSMDSTIFTLGYSLYNLNPWYLVPLIHLNSKYLAAGVTEGAPVLVTHTWWSLPFHDKVKDSTSDH